jgi:hypothetical protein
MHIHIKVGSSLSSATIPYWTRGTHVVLSKFDTGSVPLDNLLNQIGNSRLVLESTRMIPFNPSIIRRESTLDGILKDGESIGAHFSVILNILDKPPYTSARARVLQGEGYLQGPSRQLYLGFLVESSKLGIRPCLSVVPKARI